MALATVVPEGGWRHAQNEGRAKPMGALGDLVVDGGTKRHRKVCPVSLQEAKPVDQVGVGQLCGGQVPNVPLEVAWVRPP